MERDLPSVSSRQSLTRRIDRCYLVAAGTKVAAKRDAYLIRARQYRAMLRKMTASTKGAMEQRG